MSVAGLLDAMRSDYPPAVRLVWQCLENHAIAGSRCWRMTHEQIAAELKLSVRQVQRAVETLASDLIIRVERFKRRVSTFHMLRTYGESDGGGQPYRNGHAPDDEDLTPQFADSTEDLTGQIVASTPPPHEDLTGHFDVSSEQLTGQIVTSTSELTGQIVHSESTNKNPTSSPPTSAPGLGVSVACPDFETFWEDYPRKADKGRARAAWGVAIGKASPQTILDAMTRAKWPDNPRFIPYPANWLNGERWLDEEDAFDPVLRAAGLRPEDFLNDWGRTLQ